MHLTEKDSIAAVQVLRVCIGIVTCNRAAILPRAIESALAQDYPLKEVVIVDDGSTDSTWELKARYPQVRWITNPHPVGCIQARNQLMMETVAECYASLDDDSWFLETDALSIGIQVIQCDRAAAVCYDILDDRRRQKHKRAKELPVNTFIGCGHLLDLRVVRQLNGYTTMPGSYGGEEKDLSLRLLDSGHDVVLLPGVHVWHDKTMTARDVKGQHRSGVCNDLMSTAWHCPPEWKPFVLTKKVINHFFFAIRFALRGTDSRDAFDQTIVRSFGRWLFIKPALLGIGDAIRLLTVGPQVNRPVSKEAWRKFRYLTCCPTLLAPVGVTDGNPEQNPSVTLSDPPLPSLDAGPVNITAIVSAYNRPEQTVETIRRIMACEPPPAEILVHVDGNQVACAQLVRREFPDLKLILALDHLGPGGSRNVLLSESSQPLVASFDDDSYPMDLDFFQRACWLAAIFPETAVFTGEVWLPGMLPTRPEKSGHWVSSFLGGASVQRRDIMLQTSGYVSLPIAYGMEELDMGLRLIAQDKQILQTSWLRVFHNNDLGMHETPEVTAASVRNVALLTFLRYPLIAWAMGFAQLIKKLAWLLRNGRRKGVITGLLSIPSTMWRYRKKRHLVSFSALWRFLHLRSNTEPFAFNDAASARRT